MRFYCVRGAIAFGALCGVLAMSAQALASTPTEKVIYSFQGGNDGANPVSDLIADNAGNFYGTTTYGGSGICTDSAGIVIGCGTVFKLSRSQSGKWTETVLYSFQGVPIIGPYDSGYPLAGVVVDAKGNLYGTTSGTEPYNDWGTVFQLSPPATKGGAWTKTILYQFGSGYDGANPRSSLIFDSKGQLHGTASIGAPVSAGSVFRLTPPTTSGNPWTFTILYTFQGGDDGQDPSAVNFDSKGNLFGTTSAGGGFNVGGDQYTDYWSGGGTFFEITPGQKGKLWNESVPFLFTPCVGNSFDGTLACGTTNQPESRLIMDASGNFHGTTEFGGTTNACDPKGVYYYGCGTVFQFVPPASAGGSWTQNILYIFENTSVPDGAFPLGALTLDGAGNLFGTTPEGCNQFVCFAGSGTVFELSPLRPVCLWLRRDL